MSTVIYGQFAPVADAPQYRLTRRGRLVLFFVPLVLAVGAAVYLGSTVFAANQSGAGSSVSTQTVVVQPGQTLWDIAATAAPNRDVRDTVDEIVSLNGLENSSNLQIGTELEVPVTRR